MNHTQNWVAWFRARGHEVRVWSLEPGPPELDAQPLPAAPLPGFLRYPLAAPAARAALDRFRPDVIDAHFVPNYGMLAALTGRAPLCVSAWGSDLLVLPRRNAAQRARARFVLRRADAIVADSDNLARAALDLGAAPERVHAIPWGVDLEFFRDRGARDPGLLLSTRMHDTVYDLPTLFEGVAPVMAADPNTTLVITGDGPLRPELERLAARRLPAGRHRFVGRVPAPELARLLASATFFLSASRSDSTSLSLLEAMASGAVPVVSEIEGNRQWVGEDDGARTFAPGDAASLTRALERARADEEWRERARRRNRSVVEERGDRARNMASIEALFERLARDASAGRMGR